MPRKKSPPEPLTRANVQKHANPRTEIHRNNAGGYDRNTWLFGGRFNIYTIRSADEEPYKSYSEELTVPYSVLAADHKPHPISPRVAQTFRAALRNHNAMIDEICELVLEREAHATETAAA